MRLYRNQVFHSQYNGGRFLNGGVWDMLWLPLYFRQPAMIKNVLVLGVGAGAAIKKMSDQLPEANIIGIDIDAIHLSIAKRYVGLNAKQAPNVKLVCADAVEWLKHYKGPKFDVIVDDLFYEENAEPLRAVSFEANKQRWLGFIKRQLKSHGLLVANCVSAAQAGSLIDGQANSLSKSFPHGCLLRHRYYENVFSVVSHQPLLLAQWREQLATSFGTAGVKAARKTMTMRVLK